MEFPVLCTVDSDPDEFVGFWNKLYSGYGEDFHQLNIGQPPPR